MVYADLMKRGEGDYPVNKLYERAFKTSDPAGYLWPYIYFLLEDGRQDEAFGFIRELKKAEGGYGKLARLLEAKASSIVREKGLEFAVSGK
jgi:hypothetical protein